MVKLPRIKSIFRVFGIITFFSCYFSIILIMMPPEIISKTFWHLFSHVAIALGHSPLENFGPFHCLSDDEKTIQCTLNNYANGAIFINAKLIFWLWFKAAILTSIVITIFISLYVYCINKMVLLQQEYDVCKENITLLKACLNKATDVSFNAYQNKCDVLLEESFNHHNREFEIYLDTLHSRYQKQPEEKKAPENDGKDINATSEFEF